MTETEYAPDITINIYLKQMDCELGDSSGHMIASTS